MRLPRACVVVGVLGVSGPAGADVLSRVIADVDGGTAPAPTPAPPEQSSDLTAWAGAAKVITLPEVLAYTVQHAPALASATFDIAQAEARIEQTQSRNDWLVHAQLQGQRGTNVLQEGLVATGTNVSLNAGIGRATPWGGTADISLTTAYSSTVYGGSDLPLPDQSYWVDSVQLSLTQPLLKGGGRSLFEANEKKAQLSRDVTVLAKRLVAIQAVQQVVSAYWDLVLAERSVAITRDSLLLARERLRVTTIGADGGKIPRSEIPAVQQIIATREEDVLNGELAVLNASIALRRAAGLPIGAGELGLQVETDLDTKDAALDLGALVERAYQASPELAELAKQEGSATIDIAVAENGLLPQLDAALSMGPSGNDSRFGTAWKNLVKLDDLSIAGTLTFQRSIEQRDVRGRARELREARQKLTVTAVDLRAQLAQTMARAVAQLELARRRVELSQRAIDLANQNIQIETNRFNLGKSTNFDVLNRLEELRQAELRKAQAQVDWHKGQVVVEALTGDLLPTYGVNVP